MTLRLPEPLPYTYVDKMIDSMFKFTHDVWTDEDGIEWESDSCRLRNRSLGHDTSTYPRAFFNTIPFRDYPWLEEDEDGYVDGTDISDGMCWTAQELTEEELDYLLDGMD